MIKQLKHCFAKTHLVSALAACLLAVPASADDIEVFNAAIGATGKPNLLFVLDFSGSMKHDIDGVTRYEENDPDTTSRGDVLLAAVEGLLAANMGKINVGIGSLFAEYASGAKWPVSDIAADASAFDPDIPAGTMTVADAINSQLANRRFDGSTSTVNGLAEAAAYFSADPVLREDSPANHVTQYTPDQWNGSEYDDGNNLAALPWTYSPVDAYQFNAANSAGSYGLCYDYRVSGGDNECEDYSNYYDCVHVAALVEDDPDDDEREQHVCKYDHPDKYTTPNYIAPVAEVCSSNYIILISDGSPTSRHENAALTNVLTSAGVPNGDPANCEETFGPIFTDEKYEGAPDCGYEIVDYLANSPTPLNAASPDDRVITYSVGFAVEGQGQTWLKELAARGKGQFFSASDPAELTEALNSIVDAALSDSKNFTEITIDIDPASYTHANLTYLPVFKPTTNPSWSGNLKGFFIDENGLVDINGNAATIVDADGLRFADTSQSFWSSIPDGAETLVGGAGESITELPPAPNNRNMYTYFEGSDKDISRSDDAKLNPDNDLITNAVMGNVNDSTRETSLNWLANAQMGDPLHSKPVVVNYDNQKVVFHMTNQGFIHAFDATTPEAPNAASGDVSGGEELFAFMPEELLSNIPHHYLGTGGPDHIYGMDGTITRWHEDENGDGIVNGRDTITLIFGMRRGGENYYALDVTNPERPKYKWKFGNDDYGLNRLAQTWSRPSLVTVNDNGTPTRMLIFGGGYDSKRIEGVTQRTESRGNSVFMVDSEGQLVWKVNHYNHEDMKYSIPSDLTVIDSNASGMVDRVYFGDLGGQVWRLDFDDVSEKRPATVTKIADVSDGAYQPIFYPISVAANTYNGENHMTLSFGTGDRTQPLSEKTYNGLYMLKDTQVDFGPPDSSFTTITINDIYDATDNDVGSTNTTVREAAQALLHTSRGWSVFLDEGEKSLSQVLTFQGNFLATTFNPDPVYLSSGESDPCNFNTIGNLYIMDLNDAQPVVFNDDGTSSIAPDADSRKTRLAENGTIASSPVVYFPADSSNVQIIVGKESVVDIPLEITTVFWHAK